VSDTLSEWDDAYKQAAQLLEAARLAVEEKRYSHASHAMTQLEKTTWMCRLTIRSLWKDDSANS